MLSVWVLVLWLRVCKIILGAGILGLQSFFREGAWADGHVQSAHGFSGMCRKEGIQMSSRKAASQQQTTHLLNCSLSTPESLKFRHWETLQSLRTNIENRVFITPSPRHGTLLRREEDFPPLAGSLGITMEISDKNWKKSLQSQHLKPPITHNSQTFRCPARDYLRQNTDNLGK